MRVLAFDMTGPRLTIGLAENGRALGRWDATAARGRSGTLDALIEQALADTGWTRRMVDGLGVVTGPGSLTATRIGWATASGWALAADIPVAGWSTPAIQKRWWCDSDALSTLGIEVPATRSVACVVHHRGDEFYYYRLSQSDVPHPVTVLLGEMTPSGDAPRVLAGPGIIGYRDRWIDALGESSVILSEEDSIVGGDVLAIWAEEAISSGFVLNLLQSPLDYGLPPQFRKAS